MVYAVSGSLIFGEGITLDGIQAEKNSSGHNMYLRILDQNGVDSGDYVYLTSNANIEIQFADGTMTDRNTLFNGASTGATIYTDGDDSFAVTEGYLFGGDGNDYIAPTTAYKKNYLHGEGGNDNLIGNYLSYNYLVGGEGNDTMSVAYHRNQSSYSNTFEGGKGDDVITGGRGRDFFIYNRGDGNDIVNDQYGNEETLRFGPGIEFSDLQFSKEGADIRIILLDDQGQPGNDQLLIKNNTIEYFEFDNGQRLSASAFTQVFGSNINNLTDGDDTYTASTSNGRTFGKGGNDTITASSSGNRYVDGGTGNDVLKGSVNANNTLIGGEGDDQISVHSNSRYSSYVNTIHGGKGNDILSGSFSIETFLFNRGDGQDFIAVSGGTDRLKFGCWYFSGPSASGKYQQ